VPLKKQTQGTSLFTSAAISQKVVQSKLTSDFQRVRGDRVAVKVGCRSEREWEDEGSDEPGWEILKRWHLILSGNQKGWWIEEPDADDSLWLVMKMIEVKKRAEFRWQVIRKTWCSDGYVSVWEHEMRSNLDSLHSSSLRSLTVDASENTTPGQGLHRCRF